jgi:hypothetical protein
MEWFWLTMTDQKCDERLSELSDGVETVLRTQYPGYLVGQIRPLRPGGGKLLGQVTSEYTRAPAPDGQIPLTRSEIGCLLNTLIARPAHSPRHRLDGGLDVSGGVEVLPGECVAFLAGELLEEGPLGPPVALAERMDRVDLAQVVGQPCGERFPVQVTKQDLRGWECATCSYR